jgi:hypothetical protein
MLNAQSCYEAKNREKRTTLVTTVTPGHYLNFDGIFIEMVHIAVYAMRNRSISVASYTVVIPSYATYSNGGDAPSVTCIYSTVPKPKVVLILRT